MMERGMKILFVPISVISGLIAAMIGKKTFEQIWGLIDEEEPPEAKHRDVSVGKLMAALILQGAIFKLIRGLVDRAARGGYARVTGTWPGQEEPEPE